MKGNGIGLQGRLKDMWRRYGVRGFAGKCLVKALAILGVRVRITCHYAKKLDFYNRASKVGFERAGYVLKSKVFSWSVGGGRVRSWVKKF